MKSRQYYWTVSIWILTLLAAVPPVWSASYTGYSGVVTIDRRVKPVVTSLEPSAGTTKGGTSVTVKGDKFYAGLTTVKLAGQAISPVSVKSETELSFKTPAGSAGLVDLEVFLLKKRLRTHFGTRKQAGRRQVGTRQRWV